MRKLLSCLVLGGAGLAAGESRWEFPAPRSLRGDLEGGPCGDVPDEQLITTELKPGWTTLAIRETFSQFGVVWRVALGGTGPNATSIDSAFENCVLLDHVPSPRSVEPELVKINVQIPNVHCPFCTLQLVAPVVEQNGLGVTCDYDDERAALRRPGDVIPDGDCVRVYHSCAYVRILGDIPARELTCPSDLYMPSWPFRPGQRTSCVDPIIGSTQCNTVPGDGTFTYTLENAEYDADSKFIDNNFKTGDGRRVNTDAIYRTQQLTGFEAPGTSVNGSSSIGSVPTSNLKDETTGINKTAAAVTLSIVFSIAAVVLFAIHIRTHGTPSLDFLNEGGLPSRRPSLNARSPPPPPAAGKA